MPPDHCHSRSQAAGALANHCALESEAENPDGNFSWDCSLVKVHSGVLLSCSPPKMPIHEPYESPPAEYTPAMYGEWLSM